MKKLIILLVILVSGLLGLGFYSNHLHKQIDLVKTEVVDTTVIDEDIVYNKVDKALVNKIVEYYKVGHRYKEVLKDNGKSYSFYRLPFTYRNYKFNSANKIGEVKEENAIVVQHFFTADEYFILEDRTYKNVSFLDTVVIKTTPADTIILSDWK